MELCLLSLLLGKANKKDRNLNLNIEKIEI
jgi:hypothetical protein